VDISVWGSFCFGATIGWGIYHALRQRDKRSTLGDVTVAIAPLVGPGVLTLLPTPDAARQQALFGVYGAGLALGFFLYYLLLVVSAWTAPATTVFSIALATRERTCQDRADAALRSERLPPDAISTSQGSEASLVETG
jgi:hypothetical protein